MKSLFLQITLLTAFAAISSAHFTWLRAERSELKKGETIRVAIGNGHSFPNSETAIVMTGLKLFAVSPSGRKTELDAKAEGKHVVASFQAAEDGLHHFYFVQDRGVLSRTPRGVQPGGRDKNPNATQTFRMVRTASNGGARADDAPFQLVANRSGNTVTLSVLKNGKPCPGAAVSLLPQGGSERKLGQTGPDGRLEFSDAGVRGPVLFVASLIEKKAAGASYDTDNFTASARLTIP